MKNQSLIFVYNAESGIFSGIKDLIHKSILPKTYGCNLCYLTYSGISMKNEWKEFVDNLPIKATFLHKDEFAKNYPSYAKIFYPVVYKKVDSTLTEIISAIQLNKLKTIEQLKALVKSALRSHPLII